MTGESGQPILGQMSLKSLYYEGIRKSGEEELHVATDFNQQHLLESKDPIIRYIGLGLLKDYIPICEEEGLLELYGPLLSDPVEIVRTQAHKNAFSSGLLFPDSNFAFNVLTSAFEDKYSPDVGPAVMQYLMDIMHWEDHAEMRKRFFPIARKYYAEKYWHEPTRAITTRYISYCVGLGIFRDPTAVVDLFLNDPSSYVRWEISWVAGMAGGRGLIKKPSEWEFIFNRFKDYPLEKYPELHSALVHIFLFNDLAEEALKTDPNIREYFVKMPLKSVDASLHFDFLFVLGKRLAYNDKALVAFAQNGLESDNPRIRRQSRWLLKEIEGIYERVKKRKRPTPP